MPRSQKQLQNSTTFTMQTGVIQLGLRAQSCWQQWSSLLQHSHWSQNKMRGCVLGGSGWIHMCIFAFCVHGCVFFPHMCICMFNELEATALHFGVRVVCEDKLFEQQLYSQQSRHPPCWHWVAYSKESGCLAHCPEWQTNAPCSGGGLYHLLTCWFVQVCVVWAT